MHPLLNIGVRAARAAGSIIARYIDRADSVSVTAKARNDFVTTVDREAERAIIEVIHKAYPAHSILAEESGHHRQADPGQVSASGDSTNRDSARRNKRAEDRRPPGVRELDVQWVVDPLDGTINFIHGFPHLAVSIGIKVQGELAHGVIFDPLRQELFTTSRGEGAQLERRRIRVSSPRTLDGTLLGTGFPLRKLHALDAYLRSLGKVMERAAGIRQAGSAALDLAHVAAGRLDGFWSYGLEEWDMAAGALMIQEAGGIVTDLQGNEHYLSSGNILVANPKLHRELLSDIGTANIP